MELIRTYNLNFKSITESKMPKENHNKLNSFSKSFNSNFTIKSSIQKRNKTTTIIKKKSA